MKKFWHSLLFIVLSFLIWRIVLSGIQVFSLQFPYRDSFTTQNPWGNFDGVHYLLIAKSGYENFQHAFFPLYPFTIGWISHFLAFDPLVVGILLSHVCFFGSLMFMYFIAEKEFSSSVARWSIIFLLCYPMSFYFASVYTESMYLFLTTAAFYFFSTNRLMSSAVLGGLASATRSFGIFIPISIFLELLRTKRQTIKLFIICLSMCTGFILYLIFLQVRTGDMLAFIHEQPVFGAGRSGSSIILLPQVLYRYGRIFLTTTPYASQYWISVLEMVSFIFAFTVLIVGYAKGITNRLMYYALGVIFLPTLSGTLSSMPRYVVSAFPVFILLSWLTEKKPIFRYVVIAVFLVLLVTSLVMFLRGWFIS